MLEVEELCSLDPWVSVSIALSDVSLVLTSPWVPVSFRTIKHAWPGVGAIERRMRARLLAVRYC